MTRHGSTAIPPAKPELRDTSALAPTATCREKSRLAPNKSPSGTSPITIALHQWRPNTRADNDARKAPDRAEAETPIAHL
jgi:hypothetical protein